MESKDPQFCKYTTLIPVYSSESSEKQIHASDVDVMKCSDFVRFTTVDLTDTTNKHLLNISIPITSCPNGLLFSWTVFLYGDKHTYSTTPSAENKQKWQDHWLQAYYGLPNTVDLKECVELVGYMSDTNWKFDCCARKNDVNRVKSGMMKPLQCSCGFHLLMSPSLIGMYNDSIRNQKLSLMMDRILSHSPSGMIDIQI